MKKKLKLNDLKIESFVTLPDNQVQNVRGRGIGTYQIYSCLYECGETDGCPPPGTDTCDTCAGSCLGTCDGSCLGTCDYDSQCLCTVPPQIVC